MDPGLYAAASAGNIDEIMKFKDKILYQVTEVTHHTVLHLAALSNNSKCVDAILDKFPSLLDKVDSRNETALHLAAGKGYTDVVKVLLNKANGLDFIRRGNVELDTALHLAVRNNHYDAVKAIVKEDPTDKHTQNLNSETPLYLAAVGDTSYSMIEVILQNCKNASVDGPDGKTALHALLIGRNYNYIFYIIPLRPDILGRVDNKGWSAFHYAASHNSVYALDALIQWGNLEVIRRGNRDSVVAVMGKTSHDSKQTAYHIAAYEGHIYILTKLLKYCPEASEVVDEDGRNILHMAAEKKHKEMILSILKHFPDVVYKLVDVQDKNGNTPLHLLVIAGCFVPELIITYRSMARYMKNNDNFTPEDLLHMNEDIVGDQLKMKNAFVDAKFIVGGNRDGVVAVMGKTSHDWKKTAHHIAAYEGHIYILTKLMEYCPDACYEVDEDSRNILHIAAEQNHKELIQSILKDFPDVVYELLNRKDKNGNTPLHLLVIAGCFVPELINHKDLNSDIRNKDNFTPEELLYMDEDIVGDQLMIKDAFEGTRVEIFPNSWHRIMNFWLAKIKSNETSPSAQKVSMMNESKRRRKDAKFKAAKTKIMKEEVELYRGRTNTQIIVTALIATVTFTVGFTVPGGYHDGDTGDVHNGLAILSKRKAFDICMVADAVGLLFSISSLFLYFISSLYQDPHEVSKFITASTGFNIVSVIAMMLTFITGTYVVLSHSPALAITVSFISCMFFLLVILLLIKLKNDPKEKFKL